jgi:hypothetical protein
MTIGSLVIYSPANGSSPVIAMVIQARGTYHAKLLLSSKQTVIVSKIRIKKLK